MKTKSKQKILFLITKSNWGGAQRYVYDLAVTLPKDQFDVVVALGGEGELIEKLTAANVRVIRIKSLQRDISFKKELLSFREINQLLATERPDILHVNSSKAGGIGAFLGRIRSVPRVIYTAHAWTFNEERSAISKYICGFFHWLTILFAHQTIAVSATTKSQMRWPFVQKKMVVVHNGRTAPNYWDKAAARSALAKLAPSLSSQPPRLWTGTIAELHPIKRHDVMLTAVRTLVDQGQAITHVIIGAGQAEAELQQLTQELGLTDHVFFVGAVHEAAQYLKAFDIFVLSSRSEALAYVIIEAAQAGLPIVASRVGGIPEIITSPDAGCLVAPNDSDAIAAALKTLIEQPEHRAKLGQAAKTRGDYFSLERMMHDTIAVYDAD